MHELAITENILNIAVRHANQNEATRVTDIHLVIGRLASIVDDSVQFYWDMISADTLCAGSKLHFKKIPAKMLCLDCANTFELDGELTPCPICGSFSLKITSGEEFFLESIEILKEETP